MSKPHFRISLSSLISLGTAREMKSSNEINENINIRTTVFIEQLSKNFHLDKYTEDKLTFISQPGGKGFLVF